MRVEGTRLVSDEETIKRMRRAIERHNRQRWSEGLIPLLLGIVLVCAAVWGLLSVGAQKSYIRVMSKSEQPPAQLDQLMQTKSYRVGFAAGALLGIHFMLGIGLGFGGIVSLRRRPTRQEELLLRLWASESRE